MSTHQGPALYLDGTRTRIVEGGADAAFLLVGSGGNVPPEFAELYGEYASQPVSAEERPERVVTYGGAESGVSADPVDEPEQDEPAAAPKPRKRAARNATD